MSGPRLLTDADIAIALTSAPITREGYPIPDRVLTLRERIHLACLDAITAIEVASRDPSFKLLDFAEQAQLSLLLIQARESEAMLNDYPEDRPSLRAMREEL